MTPVSSPRAQQHATRAAFFIPGFATAIWATLVPFAKARSGVDDATLGLILLGLGAGSLLAMPLAGVLAARLGCRTVMIATSALICLSLPWLAVASSPWALGAILFVFGAGVGAMDCTMNVQAVVVERESRRAMMSGFHAFYSIGGFVGAASTLLLGTWLPLLPAVLVGCAVMVLIALPALRHWRNERLAHEGPFLAWPRGIVLFISVLAFVAFLAEGTMLDWSALLLTDVRGVAPTLAGVGYAAFALSMTVARLFGDRVVDHLGRHRAIVLGGLLGAAGVLVLTLVTAWQASLVGYVMLGLGCANVVPALFSLAGNQTRMPEGVAITAVTTLGYAGVLAGPVLIGFAAHHVGLVGAFIGVAVAFLGVAVSPRWLKA